MGCWIFIGSGKRLNIVYDVCDREGRENREYNVGGWGYGGGGFSSGSN